jgi:hypothetical protein
MNFYSTTIEGGRAVSDTFAKVGGDDARVSGSDDARTSANQADLIVVLQFVAIGLLLTATFFIASSLAEFGQILAASG